MDKFQEITEKMHETYLAKNSDYGSSFSKIFQKRGWDYALGHLEEKIERISTIVEKGKSDVKGESIDDSLLDLANYCILTLMERNDNENL